jgi:hypothetical protein
VTDVETGRDLTARERATIARLLADEDRALSSLERVLERRDKTLRSMRWGLNGSEPVRLGSLIAATVCKRHPTGLSRTTMYRAVGRTKDAPPAQPIGSEDDDPT